uniref:Nucelotide kinase n=1 Tax=Siphoviridae sp. ctgaU3 TaxID=2825609 RepID=A0A8S5UWD3_9CAUD|nr:MAG TPA: nucelotide kinase [Siphoviridae sp. ctgaU3]
MSDSVAHPDHYTQWPVEAIDLTERETFLIGNILKYAIRAGVKSGSTYGEDMAKACWYARRHVDNIASQESRQFGLDSLQTHFADAVAYLTSRQEDTAEMRAHLQDQLAAIYDQTEKGACEAWDAT